MACQVTAKNDMKFVRDVKRLITWLYDTGMSDIKLCCLVHHRRDALNTCHNVTASKTPGKFNIWSHQDGTISVRSFSRRTCTSRLCTAKPFCCYRACNWIRFAVNLNVISIYISTSLMSHLLDLSLRYYLWTFHRSRFKVLTRGSGRHIRLWQRNAQRYPEFRFLYSRWSSLFLACCQAGFHCER